MLDWLDFGAKPHFKTHRMRKKLYKVTFINAGRTLELYARHVASSSLWGFTEVGDLDFAQNESVVVDPNEEKLRDEFRNTKMLHLPMHCILRVEEVEKRVPVVIRDIAAGETFASDTIRPFPMPPRGIK